MNTFTYADTLENATTIRDPVETFLHIDSNDRYKFDPQSLLYDNTVIKDENNFIINNNQNFNTGYFKRLAVTELDLPFVTPNVNKNNNKLWLTGGNSNVVANAALIYCEIPEGFYNGTELANIMETTMNSATGFNLPDGTPINFGDPDWTVTYNLDGTFTLDNTTDYFFVSTGKDTQWDVPSVRGIKTLNDIMGFNYGGPEPALLDQTQTGGVASMSYTRYIDVVSNKLTKFQNAKDGLTQLNNYNGILCRIYLDSGLNNSLLDTEPFGTRPCINLYREYKNPKFIQWNRNEFVSDIDIKLYDDLGQPLYIPTKNQGSNFYLTLQLSES